LSSLPTATLNALNAASFARTRRRFATQIVTNKSCVVPTVAKQVCAAGGPPCPVSEAKGPPYNLFLLNAVAKGMYEVTISAAAAFPYSPAHTRPPPLLQNFPPILLAQFCPEGRLPCGDEWSR